MKNYLKLIRLEQWYKNLVIFIPLLFTPTSQAYTIVELLIGLIGFSTISSITYIINDWVDREKDAIHPTKKHRPLAAGKISGKAAITTSIFLAIIVTLTILKLGLFYGIILGSYFLITNAYSFGLKNLPLLDILIIAGNFTLRTLAGVRELPTIDSISYFGLIFGIIVIFLTHKRRSDIKLLGSKAISHKPVLKFYTKRNSYIFRAVGYIFVILSLYLLWQNTFPLHKLIGLLTLLFVTSAIFSNKPELTIKPHYLFKNVIWVLVLIGSIIALIA